MLGHSSQAGGGESLPDPPPRARPLMLGPKCIYLFLTRIYPQREGRPSLVSLCLSAIFVQRRYGGGIRKAFDRVNTSFLDFDFLENKSLGTSLVCQRFPKKQTASSRGFRTSTNQSPILIPRRSLVQDLYPITANLVCRTISKQCIKNGRTPPLNRNGVYQYHMTITFHICITPPS